MDILGYIGFALLIFLAATWTIGVRVKPEAGVHTIIASLFFLISAVIVGVSGVDKLHSLWILPTGFILSMIIPRIAFNIPVLYSVFKFIASAFASIVRIGIPTSKIKASQETDASETIKRVLSRKKNDN